MPPLTCQPTRSRLAVLALVCAAAVGLGACGGDDDGDGDAASQEGTPAESAATDTTTDTEAPTEQGDPRAEVEQLLSNLLAAQGLSDQQIDCVVSDLRENVSDAEIADAITNARLSNDVIQAATAAALGCRDTGG